MIFGESWKQQPITGSKKAPLPGGSKYELSLYSETPFTLSERLDYEKTHGWKCRSVLGICMFVAQSVVQRS